MDNYNLPYRQTKRTIILGAPGTGKTTLLHRVLAQAGQKTLVITPYMNEWCERDANGVELYPELVDLKPTNLYFTGIRRHVYRPKYTFEHLKAFRRGIIVFDDCRGYFKANLDDKIHNLLLGTRQNMIDVFAVAHGFREVPPVFFTFATDFILFRTEDNLDRRASDIRCIDIVRKMQEKVNRDSVHNPFTHQWFKL